MKSIIAIAIVLVAASIADAGPFGFRRASSSCANDSCGVPQTVQASVPQKAATLVQAAPVQSAWACGAQAGIFRNHQPVLRIRGGAGLFGGRCR